MLELQRSLPLLTSDRAQTACWHDAGLEVARGAVAWLLMVPFSGCEWGTYMLFLHGVLFLWVREKKKSFLWEQIKFLISAEIW